MADLLEPVSSASSERLSVRNGHKIMCLLTVDWAYLTVQGSCWHFLEKRRRCVVERVLGLMVRFHCDKLEVGLFSSVPHSSIEDSFDTSSHTYATLSAYTVSPGLWKGFGYWFRLNSGLDPILGIFTGVLAFYLHETHPRTARPENDRLMHLLRWKYEKYQQRKMGQLSELENAP